MKKVLNNFTKRIKLLFTKFLDSYLFLRRNEEKFVGAIYLLVTGIGFILLF